LTQIEGRLHSAFMTTTFRIIDKLGGQKAVEEGLVAGGDQISYRAIRYWHEEGKIPDARQAQLIRLAHKMGVSWTLDDFEPERVLESA